MRLKKILNKFIIRRKLLFVHIPKCGGNSVKKIDKEKIIIWDHNIRKSNYVTFPNSDLYKSYSCLLYTSDAADD